MTINQFIDDYKLRKNALEDFGITYYILREYGDMPIDELPAKYKTMMIAAMARYGVQYE